MEIYHLTGPVKVFGIAVPTFPEGVGEAFETLAKAIENGFERSFYGISYFDKNGAIIYKAAAEERYEGEAKKYKFEQYIIPGGDYLCVSLHDWRQKTDCIKDVFHEMMQDDHANKKGHCIEWYKDDTEMYCMIKKAASIE